MAGEPVITVVGNATADAELRFVPSGAAVCNFTVACTPRIKNGEQWEDGETVFYRCTGWRDMAENMAESIKRGMRLVVTGRFKVRGYEVEGQQRQSLEIDVDEVGASMRYASVTAAKVERQAAGAPPATDQWTTQPPQGGGWGAPPAAAAPTWAGAPAPAQPAPQAPPAQAPPAAPPGWGPPPAGYDQPPY
jgi:single-strand DNA-binding protein